MVDHVSKLSVYKQFKGYSQTVGSTNTSYSSSNGTASSVDGPHQTTRPRQGTYGHESMEEATSEWELFSSGSLRNIKSHDYKEAPTYDSLPSLTSQKILRECRMMNTTISKSQSSPANLSRSGIFHTKITNTVYKKTKSTVV